METIACIETGQVVEFQLSQPAVWRGQFQIKDRPCLVILEAFPNDQQSDPDIYLDTSPEVSEVKHKWKANNHGPVKIEFGPMHPHFQLNQTYFVAVYPYRQGINSISVKLTVIEARPIQRLESGITLPLTFKTTNRSQFLTFKVEHTAVSFLLIELSKKKNFQMFISQKFQYPAKDQHFRFAFGDFEPETRSDLL